MTKEEFEAQYATRSGLSVEKLHICGQCAVPCDCNELGCRGWKMVDAMDEAKRRKILNNSEVS